LSYLRQTWKSWARWFAVVTVFAIACGFLSNWQFHRREEKLIQINRVVHNFDTPAVAIARLLPTLDTWSPELEWRAVELKGHYLPKQSLLARNRPNQGSPGFEQLVPFVTDSGNILVLSRGWVATGNQQDYPDVNPLPTVSERTVTVRLRPSEQHDSRTAPEREVPNIEVPRIAKLLGLSKVYQKSYGRVYADSTNEAPLQALEAPATEEGNNFSYALQWILFAVMAFGALFYMIRQERDRSIGKVRTKVRKQPSDEEIEDAN
jgi:cytochrome oxidase assembly protein ShyY1